MHGFLLNPNNNNSTFCPPPEFVIKMAKEKEIYRKLKEVPDRALASSGYSEINLAKLFQAFSAFK